jgi:hypothetical protein
MPANDNPEKKDKMGKLGCQSLERLSAPLSGFANRKNRHLPKGIQTETAGFVEVESIAPAR